MAFTVLPKLALRCWHANAEVMYATLEVKFLDFYKKPIPETAYTRHRQDAVYLRVHRSHVDVCNPEIGAGRIRTEGRRCQHRVLGSLQLGLQGVGELFAVTVEARHRNRVTGVHFSIQFDLHVRICDEGKRTRRIANERSAMIDGNIRRPET